MGGFQIIVPPELAVDVDASAIMGGFDERHRAPVAPAPDQAVLRITGWVVMGGVEVVTMLPGETDREARRRSKRERRANRRAHRALGRAGRRALPPATTDRARIAAPGRHGRRYHRIMRCAAILAGLVALAGCGGGTSAGNPDAASPAGDAWTGDGDPGRPDGAPGGVWQPSPGTSWQWQLSGAIDTSFDVAMYDIDLFDTPQGTIDALHAAGRTVICYVDAGSWEPGRPDSADFPAAVQGKALDGWPDEKWLDVADPRVRALIDARLDVAVTKHCDGVEPDNVDGYANDTGFALTGADQLAYNAQLAADAHARGLSVGLKNDLDQIDALVGDFDWALDEECFTYDECDRMAPFTAADKAVFQVEYGAPSLATSICPKANALDFDTLIKNLDLDAPRTACR